MTKTKLILALGIGALAAAPREKAWGQVVDPKAAGMAQSIRAQAIDLGRLTPQQIRQLPDSQPVTMAGKTATLGELRARQKAIFADLQARLQASEAKLGAALRARKAQGEQAEQRRLDAERAKLAAQLGQWKAAEGAAGGGATDPRVLAIRQEAIQLRQQMRAASPADKAKIRERARQLIAELKKLGVG